MSLIHDISVSIPFVQLLNNDGVLSAATPEEFANPSFLKRAYHHLTLTRLFDQHAVNLQRTGRLGTYASCLGQEAVSSGTGFAMHDTDVLAPYYRDQAAQLLRGVKMEEILRYWGGDERGNDLSIPRQDLPNCVPIATQITHAAGIATAMKIRGEKRAVVTTCGDGATSRGDFYEPLNLAGVWHLPMVIVINNNQWAISVPRSAQSNSTTLAQKAVAAGIPGIQVDGNDVVGMTAVVSEAMQRARAGKGPTLIEAVTFRLCDHTTADDMRRYCDVSRIEAAWQNEPIARLRKHLEQQGWWNDQDEQKLHEQLQSEIAAATNNYLAFPQPLPEEMFDYLYATLPEELYAQREYLLQKAGRKP